MTTCASSFFDIHQIGFRGLDSTLLFCLAADLVILYGRQLCFYLMLGVAVTDYA